MKKLLILFVFFVLSLFSVVAQEVTVSENSEAPSSKVPEDFYGKDFEKPENLKDFFSVTDFVIDFCPSVYVNPESGLVSAPSPVVYPVSIGFLWPNYTFVAIEPTVSMFMMYHLWYGSQALPAEIENRTSSTFTLIFNIPAVFSIYPTSKTRFQFSGGLAVVARIGILAGGVKSTDSGYSGSAGEDLSKINQYFWQNARFLYLSTGVSWLYSFTENLKAGPVFKMYFPVGSVIGSEGLQGMIISFGLKITL